MIEPGRKFVQGVKKYRYWFNGKENDSEVKGEGNQQDYGMRVSDPRLGRFLSEDPITKKYPELTPYQFASNRPIDGVDEDGLEYSPAGRSGIHQLATDATAVQHYHADPTLLNKQVANAPERQHARAAMEIQQHVRQKISSQSNSTVGQGQAPTPYSIERKKVLNENYYALHPPASALEKNKHFQKFAEHMALPIIEGAAGDGLFRVLGKAGSALFKVSKAATPAVKGVLNPGEINFMQSSIKNATGEFTVLGNAQALKSGALNPEILRIKVRKDASDKVWTLDHRRLAAFRLSGLQEVPIQWVNPVGQMWKMTTTNGGTSIWLKFGGGNGLTVR